MATNPIGYQNYKKIIEKVSFQTTLPRVPEDFFSRAAIEGGGDASGSAECRIHKQRNHKKMPGIKT